MRTIAAFAAALAVTLAFAVSAHASEPTCPPDLNGCSWEWEPPGGPTGH